MLGFFARVLITAAGLWIASELITSIRFETSSTLLLAALLLGVVNAVVRPVVVVLTIPITIVTLGLFLVVINAAMLKIVAAILPGFSVGGFWPAMLGAMIVSLTSCVASWCIGPRGRYEILVVRREQP